MKTTAHLAAIEDLLAEPFPAHGEAGSRGLSGPALHMTCLRVFERTVADGLGDDARAELSALVRGLWPRFGHSRTVALDGFLDPGLKRDAGAPLTEILAGTVIEMYGWNVGLRWLGVGLIRGVDSGPPRLVAVVAAAEREELSPRAWAKKLISLTGRTEQDHRPIDWTSVETRLGLSLPGDYRLLAEHFGAGAFDHSVELHAPDSTNQHSDLIARAVKLGALLESFPEYREGYSPYPVHPAAEGLLQWGATSAEHEFYWLTADADPDKWPILARSDSASPWKRFDCSASEFVCRMLTDSRHPYSIADHFETHWFDSYEQINADDSPWDEP